MEKYTTPPFDTMGKNIFRGCMNERFICPFGDRSAPFYASRVGITFPDKDYYIKRTRYSNFILEYVVSGKGFLEIEGTKHELSAGDVYLISPGRPHAYGADKRDPYEKIWINFSSDMFMTVLAEFLLIGRYVFKDKSYLKENFENLIKIASDGEKSNFIQTELCKAVFSIFAELSKSAPPEPSAGGDFEQRAKRILGDAYNDVKIKNLAEKLCVSEAQLIKRFKAAYGVTPYQFLLTKKIEAAKELLLTTNLTVKEISLRLFFQNEHYFSTIFKEKTGVSPTQLRKRGRV